MRGVVGGDRLDRAVQQRFDKRATIIILTNDAAFDAKGIADRIVDRLLFSSRASF